MKNIELNAGGFIGAFLGAGIAAAIIIPMMSEDSDGTERGPIKLIIAALIGGAIGGNYLWARFVQKPNRNDNDQEDENP